MSNYTLWKDNVVPRTEEGFNLDEFKFGGLHEKHAVDTWKTSQHLLKNRGTLRRLVSR
jgi:hypothetical protein